MPHEPEPLPYTMNALEPHISKETFEYHYGKHYKAYISKVNAAIEGTDFANASLVKIIQTASGSLFNNAAQIWNHHFYWSCMSPQGGGAPTGVASDIINKSFGSFETFKKEFSNAAASNFGSGWTWVVKKDDGTIAIENTSNASNPIKENRNPALTIDIWEHAYYIDYRNARPKYIEAFWNVINWDFINKNLG